MFTFPLSGREVLRPILWASTSLTAAYTSTTIRMSEHSGLEFLETLTLTPLQSYRTGRP